MRFPQEFVDQVREANDIVEIIGQYTELRGNGHRLSGRCPFPDHNDKSPSFSVSADSQLYHCYGCKKGGSVYTFLTEFNSMSFPEAVEFLARRASIALPEPEGKKEKSRGPSRDQKDMLLKVNKTAAVYFYQQLKSLPSDHPARGYLAKRGLTDEIVEKFKLGLAPDDWQGLTRYLKARKVPLPLGESLGLLKPKKSAREDDSHFDLFRDRLMFPDLSPAGEVVGFGGRSLNDQNMPKYLNSSDSPIFSKGRVLYGLEETGKYIRFPLDVAIVVEGYMDALALYAVGIRNVVAILGTAFTADHAKILKRYTRNVVMLLDGDDAGINGAERSLPILLEADLMPKGFLLPEKMDPDDFVKQNGAEKLREEMARAPELFSLLLSRKWMRGYHGSASEKVQIIERVAEHIGAMPNRQLFELYVLETARQLDVDMSWVRRALTQSQGPKPAVGAKPAIKRKPEPELPENFEMPDFDEPAEEKKIELAGISRNEAFVVSLLLHSETLMRELVEAGADSILGLLVHPGGRSTLKEAVGRYQKEPSSFGTLAASLASRVDKPAALTFAASYLPDPRSPEIERKLMADYLNALQGRSLKNRAKVLADELGKQPSAEKLKEFMSLQRDRFSLGKPRDEEQR